jgi:hypothetical protein
MLLMFLGRHILHKYISFHSSPLNSNQTSQITLQDIELNLSDSSSPWIIKSPEAHYSIGKHPSISFGANTVLYNDHDHITASQVKYIPSDGHIKIKDPVGLEHSLKVIKDYQINEIWVHPSYYGLQFHQVSLGIKPPFRLDDLRINDFKAEQLKAPVHLLMQELNRHRKGTIIQKRDHDNFAEGDGVDHQLSNGSQSQAETISSSPKTTQKPWHISCTTLSLHKSALYLRAAMSNLIITAPHFQLQSKHAKLKHHPTGLSLSFPSVLKSTNTSHFSQHLKPISGKLGFFDLESGELVIDQMKVGNLFP